MNRQLLEELTREGGPGDPDDAQGDRSGDLLFKGESLTGQEGTRAQQQPHHEHHASDGGNGVLAEEQQKQRLQSNGLAETSAPGLQDVTATQNSRGLKGAAEGVDALHSSPAVDRCWPSAVCTC